MSKASRRSVAAGSQAYRVVYSREARKARAEREGIACVAGVKRGGKEVGRREGKKKERSDAIADSQ